MSQEQVTANTNDLVDFDLDELEELPEFQVLPAGVYLVEGVSLTQPVSEKFGRQAQVNIKVLATSELAHPETDTPITDGTEFNWNAPLSNPDSLFWIKAAQDNIAKVTKALGGMYGTKSFVELAAKFPGTQFALVVANRSYKDTAGEVRKSANIKSVIVE
jgi:hypothetical protein